MPQSSWLFFFGIQQKTVWAKAVRSRGKAVILGIGKAFEGDFSVPCLVLEAFAQERLGEAVDLYYLGDDPRYSGGFFYGTDLAVVFTVLKLGAPPGSLHFWDMGVFRQHSPWIAEESVAVRYLDEALARVELAGGMPSRFFFLWVEPHRAEGFSLSISARKAA